MNNSEQTNIESHIHTQKRNNIKTRYAIVSALIILTSIAFYFLYFIKTPSYSLNQIRLAAQTKNIVLLEKHANLKEIYSNAIDDYINITLVKEGNSNPLALTMANFLKPTIVENLISKTKKQIETGVFAKEKTANRLNTPPTTAKKEQAIEKKSDVQDYKFKSINNTIITDNIAIVSINLVNKNTGELLKLNLKMNKLEDRSWQLVKINNLKEILPKIDLKNLSSLLSL